jgi:hypothetical protein
MQGRRDRGMASHQTALPLEHGDCFADPSYPSVSSWGAPTGFDSDEPRWRR